MADTIKTPFGEQKKSTVAIVGIGAAAILGIVWYRSKHSAASTTATDANIDPATGFPFGSPEDIAALQAQSTSGVGGGGGGGGGGPGPIPGPGSFTSNAEWSQYAEQWLVQNEGADPATVGNALGKYITGQSVTPDMQQVIENAISVAGPVPVAAADGYPPNIRSIPGGGGGKPGPVTGLKLTAAYDNVSATWNAVTGATSYTASITDHRGQSVQSTTVTGNSEIFRGLLQKQGYAVHITAVNSSGTGPTTTAYTTTK